MASRGGWPSSAFTSLLQSSQMPADAVGRAARRCIRSDGRCIDGHTVCAGMAVAACGGTIQYSPHTGSWGSYVPLKLGRP